ncbi:MFS transporter [Croceibacterium sp. TMG7-5b_MA50]|uniref:MFS transporter n=1 Tax=Croceibacterium sp. TMG7-5b_MA50 TaxID=3121290 RepID=UPI003221D93D
MDREVGTQEPDAGEIRLVIAASSAGTLFEWYDFFIYGTLAPFIAAAFFPSDNATLSLLLTWAGFAIGFGFRPLGAVLFGYWGDRLGRKYTFLVTVVLMGIATAGVGLIPSEETIGLAAPVIIILLRIAQGLALGGEYGGAATYVAEHSPPEKRGFYTGFIQASVVAGFVLSVAVVLACRALIPADAFASWGWRVPFWLSIALLAISLWMRLKLNESPVFRAMKAEGRTSANPFVESFTYPGNKRRILVALFGVTCGLTITFYTAVFASLSFLKGPMRVTDNVAEVLVGIGALASVGTLVWFGRLSDRIGRRKPILWGYVAAIVLLFPLFWGLAALANPELARAQRDHPVTLAGPGCEYDPLASQQAAECARLMASLTDRGIPYDAEPAGALAIRFGDESISLAATGNLPLVERELTARGFIGPDQVPPPANMVGIVLIVFVLGALTGATFGPVAALLTEMFPARIRYSSMSIPYHIGAGYFGGFLPLISAYIVARTGDLLAGLWYTFILLVVAFVVAWSGLPKGPPRDFVEVD